MLGIEQKSNYSMMSLLIHGEGKMRTNICGQLTIVMSDMVF